MPSLLSRFLSYTKGKNVIALSIMAVVVLSLPITILLLQRQQDTRQRAADTTITLSPVADSFVDVANPTKNFGTNVELRVNAGDVAKTSYLRFDLTSLIGYTITNAKLRLKVIEDSKSSQDIHTVVDDSWTETGITYANRPTLGSVISTNTGGTAGIWKEITLTDAVKTEMQTTTKLLSLGIDQTGTNGIRFTSKEATTDRPQLIVTYSVASTISPPPPSATSTGTPPTTTATVTPPIGGSCPAVASDIILVIDKSTSMSQEIGQAKTAAKLFVDQAAINSQNRVGLVTFATSVSVVSLTDNFASIKSAIDGIALASGTCTQCGLDKVNTEIVTHGRQGIKKVIVFLTDGRANKVNGSSTSNDAAEAAALQSVKNGLAASGTTYFTIGLGTGVNTAFLQQIASISGGDYFFAPTASDLATIYQKIAAIAGKGSITGIVFNDLNGNGQLDAEEVMVIGQMVQLKTTSGGVIATDTTTATSGYAFTGLCDGATYVVAIPPQSGWIQTLPANNGNYTLAITNGNSFENKNFGLKQSVAPIVHLTASPNPVVAGTNATVTVTWTVTNATSCTAGGTYSGWTGSKSATGGTQIIGSFVEDGDFTLTLSCLNTSGSATDSVALVINPPGITPSPPTSTPSPSNTPILSPTGIPTATSFITETPAPGTTIAFTVLLHSIGNSGDNRNPTASDFSNKTPLHPQRVARIEVFNSANQPVATSQATMTYNAQNGNFTGIASFGNQISTGNYIITAKTPSFLRNLFPGIQTFTSGQQNTVSTTALVAGDTNGDNKLDILDYNTLVGCYTSDSQPQPKDCDDTRKLLTDLNDNGSVDRYDYNLFLRELSVQGGF